MRAIPIAISVLASLLLAPAASASEEFPPEIQDFLQLDYTPVCTICHATDLGGLGTVVQPFGMKMMSRGLVAGDLDSLHTAILALDAEGSDVDGDGVGDIDELRAGTDPNTGLDAEPPEYGCLGRVAPTRSAWPGAALALAAAALAVIARRPRRMRGA